MCLTSRRVRSLPPPTTPPSATFSRFEAAAPAAASPDPVELAEVVRRYRDEGRSLKEARAEFGHGPDWAKVRVRAAELTIHPAARHAPGGTSSSSTLADRGRPERHRDRHPYRPVPDHGLRQPPTRRSPAGTECRLGG